MIAIASGDLRGAAILAATFLSLDTGVFRLVPPWEPGAGTAAAGIAIGFP